MRVRILPYDLKFKQAAGTSRGTLLSKRSYFLIAELDGAIAVGECGLFAGLSSDDRPGYLEKLEWSVAQYHKGGLDLASLLRWPSIYCGWEMLLADIASDGSHQMDDNSFSSGTPIPINGLIWMGTHAFMSEQLTAKIKEGYECIKLKIGGINFDDELQLLASIRKEFTAEDIEIRLDANGAFAPEDALEKLKRLAIYDIHSIEQPIRPGQRRAMAALCADSPIAIALDEELIGLTDSTEKEEMLNQIAPQYIILKPSLIGGFTGSNEWVALADQMNIAWWATSALESNIGLNAIAQWTSTKKNALPQGLGTGGLYSNNINSPLRVRNGHLLMDQDAGWDLSALRDV